MNLLPIVLIAGSAAAWLWAARKPEPAPAPKIKRAPVGSLKWDEAAARAAACASFNAGIGDKVELAKIVGSALYPEQSWPARLAHRKIWEQLKAVAADVIAEGCDG